MVLVLQKHMISPFYSESSPVHWKQVPEVPILEGHHGKAKWGQRNKQLMVMGLIGITSSSYLSISGYKTAISAS